MKRIFLILVIITASNQAFGQSEKEKTTLEDGKFNLSGVSGLNVAQTAMSNWSAGGENSFSGNAYLNGSLIRKSNNWLWSNYLIMDYGLANTKSTGTRKATDKIDFSTQLGYSKGNKWFYTVMGDLKTQFAYGYNYNPDRSNYISKFFAPAYSNISLGLEYRPNTTYSLYVSPLAGKLTFVQDDSLSNVGAFGVDKGKKFKAEVGAYFKARAKKTLMTNVDAVTSLDLFTAYNKSFGDIDVNWDLLISMKINKYLSATINTSLIYDDDIKTIDNNNQKRGPKIQFKETLGVGLAYKF